MSKSQMADFTTEQQADLADTQRWNEKARRDGRPVTMFTVVEGRYYMLDGRGVHEHTPQGPPYDHKAPVTCPACLRRLTAARA